MGDKEGAAESFRAITFELPHRPEAFFRLGAQLNRLKKYEAARTPLQKAVELRPDYVRARNSLGICLSHLGKYDESYEQFALAVETQPTFAEAYLNWGLVLANQKKPTDAAQRFRQAVEADPQNEAARLQLGYTLLKADDASTALDEFQTLIEKRPQLFRVISLQLARDPELREKAMEGFAALLELDSGRAVAQQFLDSLRSATP